MQVTVRLMIQVRIHSQVRSVWQQVRDQVTVPTMIFVSSLDGIGACNISRSLNSYRKKAGDVIQNTEDVLRNNPFRLILS